MSLSSPRKRGSSIPEQRRSSREAAAYWIARSSRAMTVEVLTYDVARNGSLWLWVPAFAGTTVVQVTRASIPSSPALPRCDDLDLVAAGEGPLGPLALRHHVVIHCDREMRAL